MLETGKNIRKTRLINAACREYFIPYRSPLLHGLREAGVGFSGRSSLRKRYEIQRRHSPLHLVFYGLDGTGWLKTDGFEGTLEPGMVWISPAGTWQMYGLQGKRWEIMWFSLARDWRWSAIEKLGTVVRVSAWGGRIESLVTALLDECLAREAADSEAVDLHARLILRLLHREVGTPAAGAVRERLNKMVNIVHRRLDHPWTVDELAGAVGLNVTPDHFGLLCQKHLGQTPMRLVRRLRMDHAADMLLNSDYSIEEISTNVGYNTAFSLSSAFKRHYGMSPRQYRKIHADPQASIGR